MPEQAVGEQGVVLDGAVEVEGLTLFAAEFPTRASIAADCGP